jgi:hypothetical protein
MCSVEVYVKNVEDSNRIVLHSTIEETNESQKVEVSQQLVKILLEELKDEGTNVDSAMIVTILLRMLNYNSEGKLSLL